MTDLYHLPGFFEPFSAISHLAGAALFLFLGAMLVRKGGGNRARQTYLTIYAGSCIVLFALSGVYHMMDRAGIASRVLARLDHNAIFLFIAGSFTPAHGLLFRGSLRWGGLILIWGAAAAGVAIKSVFFSSLPEWVGLAAYLSLGWLGLVSGTLLGLRFGWRFIRPLFLGGVAYTIGAAMEFLRWPMVLPGFVHPHEVFHVAVLVGALYHWYFNWRFADGRVLGRPVHGD
jgi:channel protein (hemolysin III family)